MRILRRLLGAVATVLGGYALAGTIGGAIPQNRGWRPPTAGVTIWVEDNGIHTGLVLPKRAAGVDLARLFPARDLRDARYGGYDHVAIGWGDRAFYVGTPTWWDVRPLVVLRAAIGSDTTVFHVEHVPVPRTGTDVRAIRLRPAEYHALIHAILSTRAHGPATAGYAGHDAFYPAHDRYTALHTCNDWAGRTLAAAGVRVGWWTPFPSGVMRWF